MLCLADFDRESPLNPVVNVYVSETQQFDLFGLDTQRHLTGQAVVVDVVQEGVLKK
jgi:hypothetical protein